MGADFSKYEKESGGNLDNQLTEKSNYILEELEKFFRPLEGFQWNDGETIEDLDKYTNSEIKINDKTIKTFDKDNNLTRDAKDLLNEERYVCHQLVFIYKNELKKLISDKRFKDQIKNFITRIQDKRKIKRDKTDDDKENGDYSFYLKDWELDMDKEDPQKKEDVEIICDQVIDYYFLKYKIYRILKTIDNDPYMNEINEIKNLVNSKKIKKYNIGLQNENPDKYINLLINSRKQIKIIINDIYNNLLKDKYSMADLKQTLKFLQTPNEKLTNYCKNVYNFKYNLDNAQEIKDEKTYLEFQDFSNKTKKCNEITFKSPKINYKKLQNEIQVNPVYEDSKKFYEDSENFCYNKDNDKKYLEMIENDLSENEINELSLILQTYEKDQILKQKKGCQLLFNKIKNKLENLYCFDDVSEYIKPEKSLNEIESKLDNMNDNDLIELETKLVNSKDKIEKSNKKCDNFKEKIDLLIAEIQNKIFVELDVNKFMPPPELGSIPKVSGVAAPPPFDINNLPPPAI
jgi:hypothetical protein